MGTDNNVNIEKLCGKNQKMNSTESNSVTFNDLQIFLTKKKKKKKKNRDGFSLKYTFMPKLAFSGKILKLQNY